MSGQQVLHDVLREILLEHRARCEKSMRFYEKLLREVPQGDRWKYEKRFPFYDTLGDLIPTDARSPVDIMRTAIATIDEYLQTMDSFDEAQWRAFTMGLGLQWVPFSYWGKEELRDYITRLDSTSGFYLNLAERVPEDEQWKYKRALESDKFPDTGDQEMHFPTEMTDRYRQLSDAALRLLD